jgi:uncharacterized protein (TIGR03083 family)
MTIDGGILLASARENAGMLRDAAAKAGADARVATCPKWAIKDLLTHIGMVHRWVHGMVSSRSQEFMPFPKQAEGDDDQLAWFDSGVEQLLEALASLQPGETIWNFLAGAPGPGEWWIRRIAHEMAIHRADAESAVGPISPVAPPELAADGIDELFDLLPVRHARSDGMKALEGNYHFHCTDVPGEWVVDFAGGELVVRREHAKCAVAVRGPASALLLFAYNRIPAQDGIEVLGDTALMDAWTATVRF